MGFWILGVFRADRVFNLKKNYPGTRPDEGTLTYTTGMEKQATYVMQQCLKASADLLLNATPANFFSHSLHISPNLKNLSLYLTVVLHIGISLARGLYPAGKSVFV